jgi:hypothetical protein
VIPHGTESAGRRPIAEQLGEPADSNWSLEIDDADAHTLNFHYPTVLPDTEYVGMAYITPRVRLEFGARGDPWPTEMRVIRAYSAEDYPPPCQYGVRRDPSPN